MNKKGELSDKAKVTVYLPKWLARRIRAISKGKVSKLVETSLIQVHGERVKKPGED